MTLRSVPFAPGEWYHCYNRGVDKRIIFSSEEDYERFLMLLFTSNSSSPIHISNIYQGKTLVGLLKSVKRDKTLVDLGAYCLMPNHIHLLLREHDYGGITSFMRKLGTGYTMYFNIKYERSGGLFQGAFKAKMVESDQNFNRVVSYIHANPAELIEPEWKKGVINDEAAAKAFLESYRYSSFQDFAISVPRPELAVINRSAITEALDCSQSAERLIEEARIYAHRDDEFLPR